MTQTLLARYSNSTLSQNSHPTALQSQVDGLVGDFAQQATDWRSLAAMMAGGMTYRLGRVGAMATGTGRLASLGIGLGAEVTAFEMTNRSLSSLTGENHLNPNLWRWDGQGGIRQGLLSSLVTFGTLKGAGRLAQGENVVVQHLLQDTGMVLGHQVSASFGITDRPQGTLAEQFLHAEATNLQMAGGMALAHHFAPGIQGIERGLDLSLGGMDVGARSPRQGEETSPLQMQPAFAAAGVGSLSARDLPTSSETSQQNIKGPTILQMSATENSEESGSGGSSAPAPTSEAPQAPAVIVRRGTSSGPRKIDPHQTLAVLPMGSITPHGNERTTYQRAMGDPQWVAEVAAMNGHVKYLGSGVYADSKSDEVLSLGQIEERYGEQVRRETGFRELKSDLPIETPWAGQIPAGLRGEEGGIEDRLLEVMGLKGQIRNLRFNKSGTLITKADQFALQGLYALYRSTVRWGARLEEIVGDNPEGLGIAAAPGLGGMNHLVRLILASAQRNSKKPFTTEPRTTNMVLPSTLADSMQGVLVAVLGPKYEGGSIGPNPVDVGACATGYKAIVQAADMFRPQWPGAIPVELAIFGSSEAPHGHPNARPSATGFNALGAMETLEELGKRLGLAPDEFRQALNYLEGRYAPMTEEVYGFWPSEGAGLGGLIRLFRAIAKGLPISSGLAGYAMRGDNGNKPNPADIGYGGRNALRTSLKMAEQWQGLVPAMLQYFSGHLTGTGTSNAAEAALLDAVLPPEVRMYLVGLKAFLGHGLGAAGMMEMGVLQAVLETGVGPGAFNIEGRKLAQAFLDLNPRVQITPNPVNGIRFAGGQSQGFAGNNAAALFRAIDPQVLHEVYGYSMPEIEAYRRRLSEREEVSHRWEEAVRTGKPVGRDIDPEHGDEPATIGKFLSWFGLGDKPPSPPTIVDMAPSQSGGTPGDTSRPPETVRAVPSNMRGGEKVLTDTPDTPTPEAVNFAVSQVVSVGSPTATILENQGVETAASPIASETTQNPVSTAPSSPMEDTQRGPEIMTRTIFPIDVRDVIVTIGDGAGITPEGSFRTTRRVAMREPDAIAHKAEDAGLVHYAGTENGQSQWRDMDGKAITLEDIEKNWGADLRRQSSIRDLPRLPLNDANRELSVKIIRELISFLPEGSDRRQELEQRLGVKLEEQLQRLAKHPIDSLTADFGGLVPDYMRDSLFARMGLTAEDLRGTRLGGAHYEINLKRPSDQTRLYLYSAAQGLNQLIGYEPRGQPKRYLPELYPHSRRVGLAFGAALEGWDVLQEVFEANRNGKVYEGIKAPFPNALLSQPPAILANMLGPPFTYKMLKKNPGARDGIVPPNMDPRVGPNTMGPIVTEVAACASAFYALAAGAELLSKRRPGQFRPHMMLLGASEGTFAPLNLAPFITGMADAPFKRSLLNQLGLTPAQASMPLTRRAGGMAAAEGAGFIGTTTLPDAVARRQFVSALIAGWGGSLGEGGKEQLMGMDEGSISADQEAINMGIDGHGMSIRDIGVVQLHGTGTPLNNIAELVSLYDTLRSYGDESVRPQLNALKALIGHMIGAASMGDLLMAVATLKEQRAPGLINFSLDQIDERFADYHGKKIAPAFHFPTAPVQGPFEAVLGTTQGFGSRNAAILLKRFDPTILRHYDWPGEWKGQVEDFIAAWPDIVATYEAQQMELRSGRTNPAQVLLNNAYSNPALPK
jgi:3-oxoacyl-(acyl-carrier-protein) synthase